MHTCTHTQLDARAHTHTHTQIHTIIQQIMSQVFFTWPWGFRMEKGLVDQVSKPIILSSILTKSTIILSQYQNNLRLINSSKSKSLTQRFYFNLYRHLIFSDVIVCCQYYANQYMSHTTWKECRQCWVSFIHPRNIINTQHTIYSLNPTAIYIYIYIFQNELVH